MLRFVLVVFAVFAATPASSQVVAADTRPPEPRWTVTLGPSVLAVPRYPGSRNLRVLPVPAFDVRYRDRFFASVQSGIGYNALRSGGVTAGPLVRPDFGRRASDGARYLGGLGKVGFAPELGGFFDAMLTRQIASRVELRQAIGGHKGLVADVSASYATVAPGGVFVSVGPRLRLTDAQYQRAYFGVTPADATRTGLSPYRPGGGLTSVGFGGVAVVPVARRLDLALIAGYDRLVGDTRQSPIVRARSGSADQPIFGVALSYSLVGGRR